MSLYVSKQNTLCLFILIECKKLCFIQKLQEQSFIQDRASVSYLFHKGWRIDGNITRLHSALSHSRGWSSIQGIQTLSFHCGFYYKGTRKDHCWPHLEIYSVVLLSLKILTYSFSLFNKIPKVPHSREELFPHSCQTAWTGHQWVTRMT